MQALELQTVYSIRLRTRFRGINSRDGMLLHGSAGWAEFSPFWDYGAQESSAWLRAAIEAAELGFPPALRSAIPVNVTIPAVGPERAHALVLAGGGCMTAKVKVAETGQVLGDEIARVEAVRDALGPEGKIRIDANGGWDFETASAHLRALDRAANGLEYAEQPCMDLDSLAALRRCGDIPIAADESIRRAQDPLAVKEAEAADVVVLKVQPLGGVRAALALAEQLALPVVVSSALETSVGISMGLALAAALPELPYACGLATMNLLTSDVVAESLRPVDGHLAVGHVTPEVELLEECQADRELEAAWRKRFAEVSAVMEVEK